MKRLLCTAFCALVASIAVAGRQEQIGVSGWYLPSNASQASLGITPLLDKCLLSFEGHSTAGRKNCLGEENSRQDARLNKAYKKAMNRLSSNRQSILKESQRAWIKLVSSECELEAGPPTGGSDWSEELAICDLHWRAYRAQFFESLEG